MGLGVGGCYEALCCVHFTCIIIPAAHLGSSPFDPYFTDETPETQRGEVHAQGPLAGMPSDHPRPIWLCTLHS